ncbi:MAG: hypothetical protein ACT4UP_10400 [Gammaproteobacteria bacterium]
MNVEIANQFHDACNAAFGFLVTDHGFQSAILEVDPKTHSAVVSFLGKNVAVECVFDEIEAWVEVKIARVVNGARSVDYSSDSAGNRVRESLYPLLVRRGVRSFGPHDKGHSATSFQEIFRTRLSKDADLLRMHGTDIINDSPQVFAA